MEKGKRISKKKKLKKFPIVIISIIFIVIILLIANNYIILDNKKKTNLIINNNNITANLKNDIIIENDIIYLSKPDVANFFDKYIYNEEESNKIITTYEKKIAAIGFDKNEITINGSDKNINAHAIKKDDIEYLPISEMKDVYDIEYNYIEKSNIVVMDSLGRELKRAIVSSNLPVKGNKGFISNTVDRIKKGSSVIVISKEDGYSKIRTDNGKIGYVKSNKLENEYLVRQALPEEKQVEGKVNLVWDYYSTVASAPDREGTVLDGVNVVSPAFFHLSDEGKLEENIGNRGKKYIEWAHDNHYKIWPMLSNADAAQKSLEITSKIMNSYEKRQELIESIINVCVKYKLDGINIDFENMKEKDKDMFSRFIIELTPRLKEIGNVLSVDVTAPDGGETWSMCFDRHVIGNVADYIAFMAYDQNGLYSKEPGTTAGYNWVKLNLNKFLQTEEIKSEKIILAVPFYSRIWTTTSDGKVENTTISMKNMDKTIPEGTEKKWDDELKQNYVEYTDGNDKKQIWIEDLDSLKAKISLVKENNLAGIGSWQKGMETDNVWEMFKNELK